MRWVEIEKIIGGEEAFRKIIRQEAKKHKEEFIKKHGIEFWETRDHWKECDIVSDRCAEIIREIVIKHKGEG